MVKCLFYRMQLIFIRWASRGNSVRSIVALVALTSSYVNASPVQGLPPGMTMHRIQAGSLDASGWAVAESTHGAFAVKIPCTFNDFSMDQSAANTPVIKSYTLGCLRPDKRKFSATRIQYRNGAKDARSFFENNAKGEGRPGAHISRSTYKDMPVVDIAIENKALCGFLRYVLAHDDVLLLATEAPRGSCQGLDAQSTEFFTSLSVWEHDAQQ